MAAWKGPPGREGTLQRAAWAPTHSLKTLSTRIKEIEVPLLNL